MKLKRTSRRLVRRIALGLAVVAVAAPSAGGMYGLPMTGYNDTAVKNAALGDAYKVKVWNQHRVSNGADEAASALGDAYRQLPSFLAGGQVTASVGTGYVSVPSGGSATGFSRPTASVQDINGPVWPIDRPASGARYFFGPIGQVPTESTVLTPLEYPRFGLPSPAEHAIVTTPEFPRFGLPSPAEHPIVTTPELPLGAGRAPLPVADSGEGFTWDDATIGIVAGLGTALVAALAGIAVMGRRDRLVRA
jgi:hypothetical protein